MRRNSAIDALRTLAILGMMAAHTSRLIVYESRPPWSRWILLIEPLIPSLFLFLVGASLTHSHSKSGGQKENRNQWYRRQARRASGLWLISALFFALEEGVRLPDALLASGILCTIAYAIVFTGALLLLPRAEWVLGIVLVFGATVFVWLDRTGLRAFPWIVGNSPLLPLCLFTLAGGLWGLIVRRFSSVALWAGLLTLTGAAFGIVHYGWEPLFASPGRSDATRTLAHAMMGGPEKTVGYYNLRPMLALVCLGIHLGILGLTTAAMSSFKERATAFLFALGRHSLGAYILHLSLLAILVVSFGMHPLKSAWQGTAVLAVVILICWTWALWREAGILAKKRNIYR